MKIIWEVVYDKFVHLQHFHNSWSHIISRDIAVFVFTVTAKDNITKDTYKVTVNRSDATVTSIAVNSTSHKTAYKVGETLDVTGLTILVTKSDSTTQTINVTSGMVTGFDSSAVAASQTLTITYDGKTTTYNISIGKADGPAAPTGLVGVKPTTAGGSDGKITGTTNLMEYADNSSFSSPTDCTGTEITGLSAGTYYVRIKATATHEAGAYAAVTVPAGSTATYTVTISGNGSGSTGSGSYTAGTTINIYAGSRSGYTFTGWTSSDVTITNASNKNASFTMPAKNVTVKANWSYNSGGGGGGGGGGSYTPPTPTTPSTPKPTVPDTKPGEAVTAVVPVTAIGGANSTASASIPDKTVKDAIAAAEKAAKDREKTEDGIALALEVNMPQGATSLTATLAENSLKSLVSTGVNKLEISGTPVVLSFNLGALQSIQSQASGGITIGINPVTELSVSGQSMIGNRPVYSITISYTDKDGNSQNITNFGRGEANLAIPYTPGINEAPGYLFGVYVDDNGNASRINDSFYDANEGTIIIPTDHLSIYGVGYEEPSAKFTDIDNHWAKEAIDFVVGRGFLAGTSETTFAPDTAMTRGMLVTVLGRLAEVDAKTYEKNSFTDVANDKYYAPYIEWAYNKGIVKGIGNSQFAPDRAVTREEIAVIFANYTKATGYKLPITSDATTYADNNSIGHIYKGAVIAMQQAGIIIGDTNNNFNPKASATRAEVSAMLERYIELGIEQTNE